MKTVLSLAICLLALHCTAQQFGANPSSIQWQQINTDTARIIFPAEMSDVAKRVASVVHELQRSHNATIGDKVKKINIVLQNQPTISNGYVALGPYRSEFFLFAPQNPFDLGAVAWADNLAIHEYRHVQQYNNFNVGLSKLAQVLFGEEGQALANAAAIPDWFFEGDAVMNETLLSHQGRGRLPDFFAGYQSLFLQKRNYSYQKLRNGSLKDFVPNHYPLGYILVSYGREKFGVDFWKKVTQDAARFKPLFYPMQGAVSKYSKQPFRRFVDGAFKFYQQQWKPNNTPFTYVTPVEPRAVNSYQYPYTDNEGNTIVLRNSYRHLPAFYLISPKGEETRIATRDVANDDYFSCNNGLIIYSAQQLDKRWNYRVFSNIKLLNIATGETQKLTNHGRYFSPDIAHDGNKWIAVEMSTDGQSSLVSMNLYGDVLYRSKATRGVVYAYPKFTEGDSTIFVTTRNSKGQMALLKINLNTGKEQQAIPYGKYVFGLPVVQGDTVLLTSCYKGSNEAWAYVDGKQQVYRLAIHTTGLYHPVWNADRTQLLASTPTADGERLVAIAQKELLWQQVSFPENALPDLYVPNALKQDASSTLDQIPNRNFAIVRYRKAYGLVNFHSTRPVVDDPEASLTFLSENTLNTLQAQVDYTYNRNETSHRLGLSGIYGGWYLQPFGGISQTFGRNLVYENVRFNYNETNANAGLRLPLNLSEGKHFTTLTLSSSINNQQVRWTGDAEKVFTNQQFIFLQNTLQLSNSIQQAPQHIFPHWAQLLTVQYRNIVQQYTARQLLIAGSLYLPGALPSHSLVLSAAWQQRDTMRQYSFSNSFPFSRGYNGLNFPRMWRLTGNYHFTLAYPDFGVANVVYFRRIRANAFYDYTNIKSLRTGINYSLRTVGGELFFDTRWWNQEAITFGVRYSHLLDGTLTGQAANQWEVVLPLSLWK